MEDDKELTLTYRFKFQYGPHSRTNPLRILEGLTLTRFYIHERFLGEASQISSHRHLA